MTHDDKKRANSLLVTLLFYGGNGQVRNLRRDLEAVHGISVTLDRVRADVTWLTDIGYVRSINDTVALTEEGREAAQGLRELP